MFKFNEECGKNVLRGGKKDISFLLDNFVIPACTTIQLLYRISSFNNFFLNFISIIKITPLCAIKIGEFFSQKNLGLQS